MELKKFLEICKPLSARDTALALEAIRAAPGHDLRDCGKTLSHSVVFLENTQGANPPSTDALIAAVNAQLLVAASRKSAAEQKRITDEAGREFRETSHRTIRSLREMPRPDWLRVLAPSWSQQPTSATVEIVIPTERLAEVLKLIGDAFPQGAP